MKNNFEHILLSVLLGTSILLGLSFWLNIGFGFNLFYIEHWHKLAELQASHTPINHGFYISFIIAIFIFLIGIFAIYRSRKNIIKHTEKPTIKPDIKNPKPENKDITQAPVSNTHIPNTPILNAPIPPRPPRLKLPSNMAQIVEQKQQTAQIFTPAQQIRPEQNPYISLISKIFSDNGYLVKSNPKISGFTPDLFAIGPNEILWIGATDVKTEDMQRAVEKLHSVFTETLEDIQINIHPFILDTMNQHQQNDTILIFKSVDELSDFIAQNPTEPMSENEQENFDSYSEYIDTVIQYIKNI